MKNLTVVILLSLFVTADLCAQQKFTINGKYNGERIRVEGYSLEGKGDDVRVLEYAPLTRLQNEVETLRKKTKELEKELDKLQKLASVQPSVSDSSAFFKEENKSLKDEVSRMKDTVMQLRRSGSDDAERMRKNISALQEQLDAVKLSLQEKTNQSDSIQRELQRLRTELMQCKRINRDTVRRLLGEMESMQSEMKKGSENLNGIALNMAFGIDRMSNERTSSSPWTLGISSIQQFELEYMHYVSRQTPVAVKTGLGLSLLRGNASMTQWKDYYDAAVDKDGSFYQAQYYYKDVNEKVRLTYLDVPLLLHVGSNRESGGMQGWLEAGIRMSVKIGSVFNGSGVYSKKGVYGDLWDVEMEDLPEYGFVKEASLYDGVHPERMLPFVLWGQCAVGVLVPVTPAIAFSAGFRCEYSLLALSRKGETGESRYCNVGQVSLTNGGDTRVFAASLEFGFIYHL
jgi:hypothetical protein